MTKTPGLSHLPPDNEDANTKALRAQGVVVTPVLKLGDKVSLDKSGMKWSGFILSIDRRSHMIDLIVNWTSKPSTAGERDNYGLFRADQMMNVAEGVWEVDPTTV
jgi:hypothetical protein